MSIFPRTAWAGPDRQPTGELYPESVLFLLVHHTAGPNDLTEQGSIDEMRMVFDYHTGPKKRWSDVAYNFFIDRFGRVFEARAGSLKGPVMADATGGNQGFAQLVCLLGDFTQEPPSPQAQDALAKTLAWLADRHQISTGADATVEVDSRGSNRFAEGETFRVNTVAGHRDVSQTACPGDAFYPIVSTELPERVDTARNATVAATPTASTAPNGSTATTTPSESLPVESTPPTTTTVAATTTAPTTTAQISPPTSAPQPEPAAAPPAAGGSSALATFGMGVVGGTVAVGIVGGLAWVINRRQQRSQRTDPPASPDAGEPPSSRHR